MRAPSTIAAASTRSRATTIAPSRTTTRRSGSIRRFALAYNNRGDAWHHKGDLDRAIADFDEAIRLDPSLALAYGNRGYVLHQQRTFAPRDRGLQRPDQDRAERARLYHRGNAYRDTEQLERAAADYTSAIRLAPNDARGWRNRGLIRLFQENYKAGIADYDKALEYDPADAYSWNNRGQAKLRLNDKKGAIADFRKALEVRPGLHTATTALRQLGVAP